MTKLDIQSVGLRPATRDDVPRLFEIQCDPDANALAGTKPRTREAFCTKWEEIFRDAAAGRMLPRVIIADGLIVGSIGVFEQEGTDSIGYWIAREEWGRGVATAAIAQMLREVLVRPLYARVASHNIGSLRALERNGFVVHSREQSPATDRYVAGETITLVCAVAAG